MSEAWLSGESRAIARARGERLVGGGVNAGSACVIRVERVGEETTLSAIQRMMERALAVSRAGAVEALAGASDVVFDKTMVGVGINDAPVLARADVSVAMGGGADLAQMRADAVLLSDSLGDFACACTIARTARRVTRQNLAWALAYNLVALPIAVAGVLTPLGRRCRDVGEFAGGGRQCVAFVHQERPTGAIP